MICAYFGIFFRSVYSVRKEFVRHMGIIVIFFVYEVFIFSGVCIGVGMETFGEKRGADRGCKISETNTYLKFFSGWGARV